MLVSIYLVGLIDLTIPTESFPLRINEKTLIFFFTFPSLFGGVCGCSFLQSTGLDMSSVHFENLLRHAFRFRHNEFIDRVGRQTL